MRYMSYVGHRLEAIGNDHILHDIDLITVTYER